MQPFAIIPEEWMERAKCRDTPYPDQWETKWLVRNPKRPNAFREQARGLCEGCPVMAQCAGFALRTRAVGVIHAGIPLSFDGKNDQNYADLEAIARKKKR